MIVPESKFALTSTCLKKNRQYWKKLKCFFAKYSQ